MPRPAEDEVVNRAVLMVANGMSAREAWLACGQPRGDAGIQNIRKRGKRMMEKKRAQAASCDEENNIEIENALADEQQVRGKGQRGNDTVTFRKTSEQKHKYMEKVRADRAAFDKVYAKATEEWQTMVSAGKCAKGENCADAVAERWRKELPTDCVLKLTGRSLKAAVQQGRAGLPRSKPGPKRKLPDQLVQSIAEFAQMQQLNGNEQKPRQLAQVAVASVKGTAHEHLLHSRNQRTYLLSRVRDEFRLAVSHTKLIDDRRWQWLTSTNMTTWFEGYVKVLAEFKFIPGIPDDKFEIVNIDWRKLPYICNGDESHKKISNEGETMGPRSHVYVNPKLGRPGKRKIEYQKHATIMVWLNYAGEVGAPHIFLASDAEAAKKNASADANTDSIRVRPEWTFGIPRVMGRFGHKEVQTFEPSFVLNEKGGMTGGGLEEFIRMQVQPAYPMMNQEWSFSQEGEVLGGPVLFQLDAGPDRYTECSLQFRADAWAKGLVLFPGLPNGTAANQVCDDLFGPYKTASAEVIDDIVAERMRLNNNAGSSKVTLDFCDLGRIINGRYEDPIELRPFQKCFTMEKIVKSVAKLGLAPVNLQVALSHKRVRNDSAEGVHANEIEMLKASNRQSLIAVEKLGINCDVLRTVVKEAPRQFIAGPSTAEQQWQRVKAAGACAGAHFLAVGAKAFNAPEVIGPAIERLQEKQQAAREKEQQAANAFEELRNEAKAIVEKGTPHSQLTVESMKVLISFVIKAKKETGIAKHTTTRASALAYLNSLDPEELHKLLCA